MSAVWGVAAILEKFFGSMHIVPRRNIGENGRIMIDKGRNAIFLSRSRRYNDTCKVNWLLTGGGFKDEV